MINRWIKTYTLTLIYTDWYSNLKLSPLTEWIDIKCFFNAISISKRNSLRHRCHQSKRWAEWGQLLQCFFILQGGISGSFISVDCWHQKDRISDEKQRRGVEVQSTSLEVVVREQAASHIFRAFSLCPRSLKHCQRENKTKHTQGADEITGRREHVENLHLEDELQWHTFTAPSILVQNLGNLIVCCPFSRADLCHRSQVLSLIQRLVYCLGPFFPSCTRPTGWAGDGSGLQGLH